MPPRYGSYSKKQFKALELVELIYASVDNPMSLNGVLGQINSAIQGDSIALFAAFNETDSPVVAQMQGIDAMTWTSFTDYYSALNPILPKAERLLTQGATWYSESVITNADLEKTEFYADFFARHQMHYCVGIQVPLGSEGAVNISSQRSKSAGPFSDEADDVFQAVGIHMKRALQLSQRLESLQRTNMALDHALQSFDHAVFAIDNNGKVIFANQRAESILATGNPLRVTDGFLHATHAEENRKLQTIMLEAISPSGTTKAVPSNAMLLREQKSKASLQIAITPYQDLSTFGKQTVALIFVTDPKRKIKSRSATMRQLYGLTPTEARIADALLDGYDLREAAERSHLTLETGRYYLKSVLRKSGSRRQSELLRNMMSLPGI